jgi:transcriptional regulator with XRE-family HTH domain
VDRRPPSNTATEMPPASKEPDVETAKIAERLRGFRTLAGLQQNELAKLANISPQRLSKYEKAQQRIDAGTLFKLVTALKITPNRFYCDEAEEPVAGQTASYRATLQETSTSNLIRGWSLLTKDQKAAVRAVISAFNRASTRPSRP